ncbi:MAG TPA: SprT family zinc-dependent metalloprotease [Caulobacteraceae bacterium]|nr:SprT family zinc-dependent metalloprotease [Caulobacteraceae bacterium]
MGLFSQKRFLDGDRIDIAGAAVRLRVSGRARRVSLRLDAAHGEIVATAPSARRLAEAAAFAASRKGWIAARLAELPRPAPFAPGAVIDLLGEPCRLVSAPGRFQWRPARDGEPLTLSAAGEGEAFARAVLRALKAEARRHLAARTELHAAALDRPMPVIAITDARGRWGSCSPPRLRGFGAGIEVGRIRYSWRLLLSPPAVLDYVCAHECAHLIEANHSPRFWAVVHRLVGDERPYRDWLRTHGARLHAVGRG